MTSKNILYGLGAIDPMTVLRSAPKAHTKKTQSLPRLWWWALAASLCLIICGAVFTMVTLKNDHAAFVVEDGILIEYTGSERDVVIPDHVVAIADYAFRKGGSASEIECVTLGKQVGAVGLMAFDGCTSLKEVCLSEENKLLKLDRGAVFSEDGKQLIYLNVTEEKTSYSVPDGVERIGSFAFVNSELIELILPESVTSLDPLAVIFNDSLKRITLNGVTELGERTFYHNISLKTVTLPKATVIGEAAFSGCTALESATLPMATSIGKDAFSNCQALKAVTAPHVTTIGESAFYQCKSLTALSFPKAEAIASGAFRACTRLSTLNIQNVQTLGEGVISETNVSILILPNVKEGLNEFTFEGASVELWGTSGSYLEEFAEEYGYSFTEIKDLDLPEGFSPVHDVMYVSVSSVNVRSAPEMGNNVVGGLRKDQEVLRVATNGTWSMFLYTNGHYCFVSDSCLSRYPSSFTPPAQADKTYGDFSYAEKDSFVIITKYNGSGVDILIPSEINGKPVEELSSDAFSLSAASIKSLHAPSVKRISGTTPFLSSCYRLTSLRMPALEVLPSGALYECVSLTEIDLHLLQTIGSDVFVCGTFTELYLSNVTSIASDAFTKSGIKTLHGISGSYTQAWAAENGYDFVDVANDYLPTYPDVAVDATKLTYTQIYHGSLANGETFAPQGVGIAHDKTGKLYLHIAEWNAYFPTAFSQFEDFASDQIHTDYQTATVYGDFAWLVASNGNGRKTSTLSVVRLDRSGSPTYGQITLGQTRDLLGLFLTFTDEQNGKLIVSYSEQYQRCMVYETADGGVTWKQLGGQVPVSENRHENMVAANFATDRIGFISYGYVGEEQPSNRTYLTVDGGITWKRWNVTIPDDIILDGYGEAVELQYQNGRLLLTVAIRGGSFTGIAYHRYASSDSGQTWIHLTP